VNIYNTYRPRNEDIGKSKLPIDLKNYDLLEGDMIVSRNSLASDENTQTNARKRKKRKIILEKHPSGFTSRWPHKIIPYTFEYFDPVSDIQMKNTILMAINHWETKTCIRFEPFDKQKHRLTHRGRVVFSKSDGG
jgi:hypothetical protein